MKIGIVGKGSDKFTEYGEANARRLIRDTIRAYQPQAVVSGHSPVGGIDIWAEEEAERLGVALDLKIPEVNQWNPPGGYGYKARNIDIAKDSYFVMVVLADQYPEEYTGRRFKLCYHHPKDSPLLTNHVKSGGCWTGKIALGLGKEVFWKIVPNYPLQTD